MEHFAAAARLDPDDPDPLAARWPLQHIGENQRAVKDFDRAIRLQPDVGLNYYGCATSLIALGKQQQAVEDLRTAMRLDPQGRQLVCARAEQRSGLASSLLARREISTMRQAL